MMLRAGTLFLVLAMTISLLACSEDGAPSARQTIELEVQHGVPITRILYDGSGRIMVGTVTICNRNGLLRLDLYSEPGYRLVNVRACAAPDLHQAECQPWVAPRNCGHNWWSFTFRQDELQPGMCSDNHRVFLRYQVVQSELLSSLEPERRLSSVPSWVSVAFQHLY